MSLPSTHVLSLAKELVELGKDLDASADVKSHRSSIVVKARELIAGVQSPVEHAMALLTSFVQAGIIRTLMSLDVLKAIPSDGSISLQELERTTGAQAALIGRLLRVVVGDGFIQRLDDGTYAHTPVSKAYVEGMPAQLFTPVFDELCIIDSLPAYFKARGAREPDGELARTHNPMTWRAGQEGKTVFEIIAQEPDKVAQLQKMMNMAALWRPYTGLYDYDQLRTDDASRVELVDIGGGDGHTLAQILAAYRLEPSECVVQDLEQTIALARENGQLPSGVRCETHDFFTRQPITGARAYQLRACLHDWSDSEAIRILRQIVPAMAPDSRVLIAENVIPDTGAQGMTALMDVMMLCIGGKERTRTDFETILDAAGLELQSVHPAPGMTFSVIEARLQ